MSEVSHQGENSAAEIESQAALWLERHHFGIWDDSAQAAFDAWLSESSAHLVAYWRLDATWNRTERLVVLEPASKETLPRQKKTWSRLLRLTAVACLILAIGAAGSLYFAEPVTKTYVTALGERKILTLPDGSKIELNTNSVLRLAGGNTRKAWLDKGEAYFQIVHNEVAPFAVVAMGHRVTDLGTAFTVRAEKGRLEVSLLEGRARLDTADARIQEHSAVLIPGDVLVATSTSLSVAKRPERSLRDALGWRQGVLVFNHATLADAAEEFNRYNHVKLIITDQAAARRTIGATFPVHDVELFARVAQQVLGLRVEHSNGNISISH